MMKSTWLFFMNEILINTCFVNQKKPCFDCLIPYIMILWNRDIFWDNYHTVKIIYRYKPIPECKQINRFWWKIT